MADPYRRIARFYDAGVEPFNASLRRYVLRVARAKPGMKVLEVGCGTGTNLELFAEAGCEVAGVELSAAMIALARKKLGDRADLHEGDASDMPFESGSFDLVVAFLTLHEMPVDVRGPVVQEMTRVVADDGRLLFIDFHMGPYKFPKGWFYRSVIVPIEIAAGLEHFRNHRDFLRRGGLPSLIADAGLTVEREKFTAGGNVLISTAKTSRGRG